MTSTTHSSRSRVHRQLRSVLVIGAAASVLLSLTACFGSTPAPTPAPSRSTVTVAPSAHPTAAPTATSTGATPVKIACNSVFTAQQVYDYNPNFVANDAYQPASGSSLAQVADDQGTTCGWIDETSSAQFNVGIAKPAPSDLSSLKNMAASTGSATQLGGGAVGYFLLTGGIGQLQAFSGGFWIVISSSDFSSVSDVKPSATVILGNLPN